MHASADVFKTNEIPVVPAEDLVPPPEDQESIVVRYSNDGLPKKSFFQKFITWFGFNGDPQSQSTNLKNAKKQSQKQQSTKQNGYVYENPAKPFSPSPQKFSQSPGYNYNDPSKVILTNGFRFEQPSKLQQQSTQGYTYEPPPQKLELRPETGYTYDPPTPMKLQLQPIQQPQNGYTYNPPPVKLQQPLPTGYIYNPPPHKLQEPPKPQPTGYNYEPPLKLQHKPNNLNDLVSSAASPTAVYTFNAIPNNQFSQLQVNENSYPCNKIPWLPIFPNANELNLLRAKLQGKNTHILQSSPGYQNIQTIARPTPERFTQHLNAHTYLPPRQRPLRQPTQVATPNQINSINSLPLQSTAQPFRAQPPPTVSSTYLPAQKIAPPIQSTGQHFASVPNLSTTPIPPSYDAKPFTANDAQGLCHFYL